MKYDSEETMAAVEPTLSLLANGENSSKIIDIMKKLLLLTLITISLFGVVNAQNKKDYYTGKTEVKGDKYTYSVEISPYSTRIFLHNNNSLNREWTIMDDRGRLVGGLSVFGNVMKIEDVTVVKETIKEVFTQEELKSINAEYNFNSTIISSRTVGTFTFRFTANKHTKRIEEVVDIHIANVPTMRSIPPQRIELLEELLKSKVKFVVNEKRERLVGKDYDVFPVDEVHVKLSDLIDN